MNFFPSSTGTGTESCQHESSQKFSQEFSFYSNKQYDTSNHPVSGFNMVIFVHWSLTAEQVAKRDTFWYRLVHRTNRESAVNQVTVVM